MTTKTTSKYAYSRIIKSLKLSKGRNRSTTKNTSVVVEDHRAVDLIYLLQRKPRNNNKRCKSKKIRKKKRRKNDKQPNTANNKQKTPPHHRGSFLSYPRNGEEQYQLETNPLFRGERGILHFFISCFLQQYF